MADKYPERYERRPEAVPVSRNGNVPTPESKNFVPTPMSLLASHRQSNTLQSSAAEEKSEANQQPHNPLPLTETSAPDPAPYPPTFAEIVALITSGADIPGIKDIPDAVYPLSTNSMPIAPRRRKPWEKDVPEDVILNGMKEGTFGDHRDNHIVQELPDEDVHGDNNSSITA